MGNPSAQRLSTCRSSTEPRCICLWRPSSSHPMMLSFSDRVWALPSGHSLFSCQARHLCMKVWPELDLEMIRLQKRVTLGCLIHCSNRMVGIEGRTVPHLIDPSSQSWELNVSCKRDAFRAFVSNQYHISKYPLEPVSLLPLGTSSGRGL